MSRFRAGVVAAVAVVAALVTAPSAGATDSVTSSRLAGTTRYGTAGAVAAAMYQGGPSGVLLARGDDFADGLVATNAFGPMPLLLTQRDAIPPETDAALRSLNVQGVSIIGGQNVISETVAQQLRDRGIGVARYAGENRYATAAELYSRTYSWEGAVPRKVNGKTTLLLASGESYADALAASPLAASAELPVLLTARDNLPVETRRWLQQTYGCPNGICIEQVIIIGGTNAVSLNVEAEVQLLGITTRRLQGSDRQGTAVAVATFARDEVGWPLTHFNLTRGDAFPDALASGPLGGREHAPTLLTLSPTDLGATTRDFIRANNATIGSFHVLGDQTAVSDAVEGDARRAAQGQ